MQDAAHSRRSATLWIDVTTSWRSRGGTMNGTLRVEQNFAAELAHIVPDRLRLCRYDATRRRFIAVPTLPHIAGTAKIAPGKDKGVGAERNDAAGIGHRIERAVRRRGRSAAAGLFRWIEGWRGDATPFAQARTGDVLLLMGEIWSRHDFSALRLLRQRDGMRIAALCHDLMPIKCPQFFAGEDFVERFARLADFLVNDVDLVIANSEQTKSDFLAYADAHGGLQGDVAVIEFGHDVVAAGPAERPPALAGLEAGKFVLSVSTIQSRKNFDLLYHLWHRFAEENLPNIPKLVIAGRRGFGSNDLLWQIGHDPVVRNCIAVNHFVSDAELAWLYRACAFTLYPSFYEGWGLPVSESLAHGKLCVASNASALVEAGQGLARHIDPLDFAAWHETIVELIRSPEKVAEAERRIKERYRALTWRQSARRLADLLQPLCEWQS